MFLLLCFVALVFSQTCEVTEPTSKDANIFVAHENGTRVCLFVEDLIHVIDEVKPWQVWLSCGVLFNQEQELDEYGDDQPFTFSLVPEAADLRTDATDGCEYYKDFKACWEMNDITEHFGIEDEEGTVHVVDYFMGLTHIHRPQSSGGALKWDTSSPVYSDGVLRHNVVGTQVHNMFGDFVPVFLESGFALQYFYLDYPCIDKVGEYSVPKSDKLYFTGVHQYNDTGKTICSRKYTMTPTSQELFKTQEDGSNVLEGNTHLSLTLRFPDGSDHSLLYEAPFEFTKLAGEEFKFTTELKLYEDDTFAKEMYISLNDLTPMAAMFECKWNNVDFDLVMMADDQEIDLVLGVDYQIVEPNPIGGDAPFDVKIKFLTTTFWTKARESLLSFMRVDLFATDDTADDDSEGRRLKAETTGVESNFGSFFFASSGTKTGILGFVVVLLLTILF